MFSIFQKPDQTFWSPSPPFGDEYGLFHKADTDSPHYLPGVLFVFIHGIISDALGCWRDLPERVLSGSSIDVDILNFEYPVGILSRSSIPDAAHGLHTLIAALCLKFRYRDIVFVAHSAGGLVVKQMFVLDFGARGEVLKRTHQVFNFGVPHAGSTSGLSESLRRLLVCVGFVCLPISAVVRFFSKGNIDWGRNRIYSELKHDGRFVKDLEQNYVKILNRLIETKQPRPESIDIYANADVVSDGGGISSDLERIVVRANHSSIKLKPLSIETVLDRLSVTINPLRDKRRAEFDIAIASLMVNRVQIVEAATGVKDLHREEHSDSPTSGDLHQEACLEELRIVLSPTRSPGRTIVTGTLGVGKSSVLRRFCRRECQKFLRRDRSNDHPLVLFFPIDRLAVDDKISGWDAPGLWMALCRAWVTYTNDLLLLTALPPGIPNKIFVSWLLDRLKNEPTVVILDGVDEFVTNHSQITIHSFAAALPTSAPDVPPGLRLILGVRDSLWGLDILYEGARVLRVGRLSQATVARLVPGLASRIQTMKPRDQQMMATPLITNALSGASHVPTFLTATGILQAAVESVLKQNKFFDKHLTLEPLALVSWIYYREFRRELSITAILKGVAEVTGDWQRQLHNKAVDSARLYAATECIERLRFVLDPEKLVTLLKHSFFFPTKAKFYSLSNDAWRDFLVTYYVALCVRHGIASGLSRIAFQVEHFEQVGDLLEGFQVDIELVSDLLASEQVSRDPFMMGNVCSILGLSTIRVSSAATRRIVAACLDDIHPLAQFVAIGSLTCRAIKHDDFTAQDLRAELRKALPKLLSRNTSNSLMRSLCTSFQRAIGGSRFTPLLEPDGILDWIREASQESNDPSDHHRSLQLSFLSSQYRTIACPERSVAHVHYLFLLTVARIKGFAIPEVCEQLPELLKSDSPMDHFFRSYSQVPEVYAIYKQSQDLWHDFVASQPPPSRETNEAPGAQR